MTKNRSVSFPAPFLAFSTCMLLAIRLHAFTEPPEIPVSKPTPGTTRTICANGCDYSNMAAAQAAYSGLAEPVLFQLKGGETYSIGEEYFWDAAASSQADSMVFEVTGTGTAVIDGTMRIRGHNLIFDGGPGKRLEFKNSSWASSSSGLIRLEGDNLVFRRCKFTGPTGYCNHTDNSCIGPNDAGSAEEPRYFKIYNNEFEYCSHKGIYVGDAYKSEIRNNVFHHTGNNAIQVNPHENNRQVDGLIIAGNAFYDNGDCYIGGGRPDFDAGQGDMKGRAIFLMADSRAAKVQDIRIYNNMIWRSVLSGIEINPQTDQFIRNVDIYNNTVFLNGSYGFSADNRTTDNEVEVRNNIFWDNAAGSMRYQGVTLAANTSNLCNSGCTQTGDPSFESETETDPGFLKITSGSPARDNGYGLSAVFTNDYFGNRRAGTWDVGAHEYGVDQSPGPPGPPSGLRIVR